jgi:hypothetical protein
LASPGVDADADNTLRNPLRQHGDQTGDFENAGEFKSKISFLTDQLILAVSRI